MEISDKSLTAKPAFFPLPHSMFEHPEFLKLKPYDRVALIEIIEAFNFHVFQVREGFRQGPYYRSDERSAIRLDMSTIKFRNARRRFEKLGWITCAHGSRGNKGSLATRYLTCQFASTDRGPYAAPWRRVWQDLIVHLQQQRLRHLDLAVFAHTAYLFRLRGGRQDGVAIIRKASIRRKTGIPLLKFKAGLGNLVREMPELFSLESHCRTFEISNWNASRDANFNVQAESGRNNEGKLQISASNAS